jgi:hypothetical protein
LSFKNSIGLPSEAERDNRPNEPDDAGLDDVSYWDVATVDEIVAMQRKATFADRLIQSDGCC